MLRKFRETLKNKQRGAIMVFFAILVPLFLGAIGLAVDAGFLYMQKAKLQDVADATALAGAGHLNDGDDREGHVASAVIAFAGANGYKDYATSSNFSPLGDKVPDSSVTLEENAAWKIAYAIDTGMKDKDAKNGELRDHVRVVILKRVPTFFIRMLFPEQREVVVKVVAAAEYVEGEEPEPVISGDTPVIMVENIDPGSFKNYQSAANIVLGKNFAFPIYVSNGDIDGSVEQLPGTGNLYVNNVPKNLSQASYDKNKKKIVWTPPLNNRDVYTPTGWFPQGIDGSLPEEYKKEYKAIRAKADAKYNAVKNSVISDANAKINDIEAYKRGEGKKRFVGWDKSEQRMINNIREDDREIELFMQNTYFDKAVDDAEGTWGNANQKSFLTNRQLLNVRKITSLITNNEIFIATTGITYGNIYCLAWGDGLVVAGSNNYFNGTLYTLGNLYVGGDENHFLSDASNSAEVSILGRCVYIGKWRPVVESEVWADSIHFNSEGKMIEKSNDNCIRIKLGDFVDAKNRSDWHIYFGPNASSGSGSGGSSSGSSGSGASKAHVRLVI